MTAADKLYYDAIEVTEVYYDILGFADMPYSDKGLETPEFSQYILTVADARKIAKAKKYTMPLLDAGDRAVYKANDEYVLHNVIISSVESSGSRSPLKDTDPIYGQHGILLKVSAKLLKSIVKVIKVNVKNIPPEDFQKHAEHIANLMKHIDDIVAPKKKAKKDDTAAPKKKAAKKDDDKKAKLAAAKENMKALKKLATQAKKAADVAQKNYEKAEKAVEKLMK